MCKLDKFLMYIYKKSWHTYGTLCIHYFLSPAVKCVIHSFKGLQCKNNFEKSMFNMTLERNIVC